jgi:hypothetical membrane protein
VAPRPSRLTPFALAGIAGPCVFTALVVVQAAMQPDYGDVELPISALAAFPLGWVQNLNFYAFGSLMIAFAVGLHLGVRPMPGGVWGPAVLAAGGVGTILAGVFPMLRGSDGTIVEPVSHIVAAFVTFLGTGVGYIVISRRIRRDPHWASVAGLTLGIGAAIVLGFLLMAPLAAAPAGPLHEYFGLLQRAILLLWFPLQLVLAVRLLGARQR